MVRRPNSAAHKNGLGSPEAIASIKYVDEQFEGSQIHLNQKDLIKTLINSFDHGFVTHIGKNRTC
jgi:hypothetical protein